jgi:hypothetical protein
VSTDGLASLHRWVLDWPEGKKGAAAGEREEEEREASTECAGREVAAGVGEGGRGETCGELICTLSIQESMQRFFFEIFTAREAPADA